MEFLILAYLDILNVQIYSPNRQNGKKSNMKLITITALFALAPLTLSAGGVSAPVVEVVSAPSPAPVSSPETWQGFYAGLQASTYDITIQNQPDEEYGLSRSGVHAGYMHDFGAFVIGAELDYGVVDFDEDSDGISLSEARVMVRAGYDLGKFLPYVTAGMAALFVEDAIETPVYKDTVTGAVLGVGVSYMITDNFIVGGQYARSTYPGDDDELFGTEVTFEELSFRASYKF
jgi:opacity protein-like surface antigen